MINAEVSIWRGFWWNGHFRYGDKIHGWVSKDGVFLTEGTFRDLNNDQVTKFNLKIQNIVSDTKIMQDGSFTFSHNRRKENEIQDDYPHKVGFFEKKFQRLLHADTLEERMSSNGLVIMKVCHREGPEDHNKAIEKNGH